MALNCVLNISLRVRQRRMARRPSAGFSSLGKLTDSNGNYTGETEVTYATPVKIRANVSPATGQSNLEMFGNLTDYDRVVVTDQVSIPIDENSVLWIDAAPTENGVDGYNYIVRRVARSFNSVAIAVRKVDVEVPTPTETEDEPSEE